MRVVVTGASGFLGRHVVVALRARGHAVRALVRRKSSAEGLGWGSDPAIEVCAADLRSHPDLESALGDAQALVHLAAATGASDAAHFADTVLGTERLFQAVARAPLRRLVLCSSFSVYDWLAAHGRSDESLPRNEAPYAAGYYAAAKVWQERLAERLVDAHGVELTILRPGYIWGPGNPLPAASVGRSIGPLHLVFGPTRRPALTHVVNCADAFATALETPACIGRVLNVVDGHDVSAWRFMGAFLARSGTPGWRVPLPYTVLRPLQALAVWTARLLWGRRAVLPTLLAPANFAENYRPLRHDPRQLREVLDWRPPLDFEAALSATFPS